MVVVFWFEGMRLLGLGPGLARRRRYDAGHVAVRRADGRTIVRATRLRFYALALLSFLPLTGLSILVHLLPTPTTQHPESRLSFQYLKKYKFAEFLYVQMKFTV